MEAEQVHNEKPMMSVPLSSHKTGKFRASYLLAVEGLKLVKKDRQMFLFPVFSALASVALLLISCILLWVFGLNSWAMEAGGPVVHFNSIGYGILFVFYFLFLFITAFFQAGLTAVVAERVNGKNMTYDEGITAAFAQIEKIFVWSLVDGITGVILWVGKITSFIFGALWGAITFYIIPVLILEEGNIFGAIKSSIGTFKKTWAETIIMNFLVRLSLLLIAFLGLTFSTTLVILGAMFLSDIAVTSLFFTLLVLLIIFLAGICILSSVIDSAFRVVLYEYAKSGQSADSFLLE